MGSTSSPGPAFESVTRPDLRPSRGRILLMMPRGVHLAVLAAVALVASAAAGAAGPPVFRGPGIVLRTPSGWYASNEPLNGVTDPVQRFVLSSYRIPAGIADAGGSYVPSSRGVIAQVMEEVPPSPSPDWRSRPQHFTLPRLGRMETLGGNRWGERLFRAHGRHFYVFIWVGRQASSAQVGQLLRALDGMTITAA
jgi:hypothetical protein